MNPTNGTRREAEGEQAAHPGGEESGVETVVSGHPKVPITIICPKWGGHRGQEAAEGIDVDFPQWCCLVEILHKSHA